MQVTTDNAVNQSAITLHPYQQRAVTNPARFTRNNWSRQVGKSFAFSLRRILRGMERRRNQIFLSAGERQSRELMMKARDHIKAMKLASEFHEFDLFEGTNFKQLEIALPQIGIRIIGLPANPYTARGFTGDVLLDEFAMHRDDRAIWASVFPTVLRGGGELDICSTPKGRQNMFYRLGSNDAFNHSTVTIDDAIADGLEVDREEIRRAMGDDELFRQEFLCEFVDETTAFLTYELIAACEDQKLPRELDLEELATLKGDVFVGIDIGRKHDLTVIWAFEKHGDLLISRGLIELRSMPFRRQFEIIAGVLKQRCTRRCCVDQTGLGMQLAEELVDNFGSYLVEPVTFTPKSKDEMAGKLRVKFEDQSIRIPVCEKIRNDLHSIQRSVTSAGNVRLQAPREDGSHADRFWAAGLAVLAASEETGPPEAMFGRVASCGVASLVGSDET